jgi:hypothetical protein
MVMARKKLTDDQFDALAEFFETLTDDVAVFEDFIDRLRGGDIPSKQELLDARASMTRLRNRCAKVAAGLARWSD